MDTSETYIKMCDCEEIQGQRPSLNPRENPHEFWGHYKIGIPSLHPLWLPRQDQLQGMVPLPSEFHRICDKLYAFTEWLKEYATYETSDCSMEQLWLAFVMKEKFNQTWDGDKWA